MTALFRAQELVERMATATNRPIRWRQPADKEMEGVIFHSIASCRRGCRLFARLWGTNDKRVRNHVPVRCGVQRPVSERLRGLTLC
eukprot:209472-Prymnesium_polylepis.1